MDEEQRLGYERNRGDGDAQQRKILYNTSLKPVLLVLVRDEMKVASTKPNIHKLAKATLAHKTWTQQRCKTTRG